jgi:hypothetical protein
LRLQTKSPETPKPSDLQDFVIEANQVKSLSNHSGWQILERDLNFYQAEIAKRIAYLNPKRPEAYEARILFLAADKILNMVSDYSENRTIAIDMLNKIENPDLVVPYDIDNEVDAERGESKDGL